MQFNIVLHVIRMSFVCHSCVLVRYSYVIRVISYVIRMYPYVACMSLVCTRISPVCHSYVLVCHPYVARSTRMSPVCHSYVLVCHPYVTRLWFYHEPLLLVEVSPKDKKRFSRYKFFSHIRLNSIDRSIILTNH